MDTKVLKCLLLVGLAVCAVGTVFDAGASFAAPPGNGSPSPTLEWSLNAELVVPDSEVAELGTRRAAANNVDAIISKLDAHGAKTEKRVIGTGEKGIIYGLTASGTGDIQSFRTLIHSAAKPQFNFLGGVTEMDIESTATESSDTVLILESNLSTGYGWHVAEGSGMIQVSPHTYEKHTPGYGIPERQTIRLAPGGTSGPIKLIYKRAWENSAPTRQLKLKLSTLPAVLNLSDPAAPTVPLTVPEGAVHTAAFPTAAATLPSHFDWREQGIVTPVRDQESCGSCWAFGTVGIMESSLGKNGIPNQDLSEQFLIDCNDDGWDCSGGLTAHKYHYDTLGKDQNAIGAVLETVKPYTASNGTCSGNYSKADMLTGWKFITGSESTIPTNDQIKSAILAYGPVTAGVCAGDGWPPYDGSKGVFSTSETAQCNGSTNHQIILVGWNDAGGYWILRNSWGAGWGIEGGYMYIKYGISRVGEGTSWVTTDNPSPHALTVTKSGSGTVTSVPSGINCGSTCSYAFSQGTSVALTAISGPGSSFVGWSGACSGTGTCTVTMNSDESVTAVFNTCTYTVTPSSKTFAGFRAASTHVSMTAPRGCSAPSVTPNETWIYASTPSFNVNTGKGSVRISVDANSTSSLSRSGSVTIADKTLPVTQAGKPCAVSLSPATSTRFSAGGDASSFTVTTSLADCAWTAEPDATSSSWVTAVSPGSGTGNGTVSYSAGASPLKTARSGRINILYNGGKAKKVYRVRQLGN
jgi:C1A family cysteine protease